MKLIDILVQELPKRGGWPGAIHALAQNSSGYVYQPGGFEYIYRLELADDWMNTEVTCEKYFDALRALKPVWDGEGLPPVGIEAEVSVDGGRTWCLYKATSENNGMRLVEIEDFTEEFQSNNWMFRPIRSEADKKRDEAILQLSHSLRANGSVTEEQLCRLYSDIAAGYIPHIRID